MKTVCILLVPITYVYHNARFKKNVKLVCNLCQIQCIILRIPSRSKKKNLYRSILYTTKSRKSFVVLTMLERKKEHALF